MVVIACIRVGIVVVVVEVPPMNVVNVPVGVIVDAVAGDFARVGENVGSQVRVVQLDGVIENRNHHVGTACSDIPGFWRVNIDTRFAATLAGVIQGPLLGEVGVIGAEFGSLLLKKIRLRPNDRGTGRA